MVDYPNSVRYRKYQFIKLVAKGIVAYFRYFLHLIYSNTTQLTLQPVISFFTLDLGGLKKSAFSKIPKKGF
jgi:hypothetical protein